MKKWMWMICVGILIMTTTACGSGGSKDLESKEGKTVVNLSIQQSSQFLQAAEKRFEEKYPDIDLQIQTTDEYKEYQTTMNTALLSGKGPDIFEISGLPIDDYVRKKILLNMDDSMEQDKTLNKSDLHINILELLKVNGGMYAMPFGFSLRAFVGDGDILGNTNIDDKNWTWKKFEETSKKLGGDGTERRYALANDPPDFLLTEIILDRYTEFVDHTAKKAKFDSPLFVGVLQQIKKMYDDKVMTSEPADIGKQLFYSTVVRSPEDLINGPHKFFSNPKLLQKPEQKAGPRIIPSSQFAIQANSPVKEEAWKFIAFLLSDDGQFLQDREGFSLLKSVNEKQLNDIQKQVESGKYKPQGFWPSKVSVSDEEFTQFKQFISTADNYTHVDGMVISIMGGESGSFFSGQKSAEEVAKLIQNKVTIYLNE